MAGAFHGVSQGEVVINVGLSVPGIVKNALKDKKNVDFGDLCEIIKKLYLK